jgi:hypothetical protein
MEHGHAIKCSLTKLESNSPNLRPHFITYLMTGSSDVDTLLKARLVRSRGFSCLVVSLSYALQGDTRQGGKGCACVVCAVGAME